MGGPGHDFMENPQALEGGWAPRIAVCSKIGSLAGTALPQTPPTLSQSSPKFSLFLQGWGLALMPSGAPHRAGLASFLTHACHTAQLLWGLPICSPRGRSTTGSSQYRGHGVPIEHCWGHPLKSCSSPRIEPLYLACPGQGE